MKQTKTILLILIIICYSINGFSQNSIETFARFTQAKGMELRLIPSNKHLLDGSLKNGISIERASANNNDFKQIGEVQAFSPNEWEQLINSETNSEKKKQLEMVYFFYQTVQEGGDTKKINFKNGIKDLRAKKSSEDLGYMVFVLSALKNPQIAEALGLTFFDKTAIKGNTYQYRAKIKGVDKTYQIDSPSFSITATEEAINYKNYFYAQQGDKKISFYWREIPTVHGYEIERADVGQTTFKKITNSPLYSATGTNTITPYGFVDENVINYKKYTYQFFAYSVFGERIKLFETITNSVDLTPPPIPDLLKPEHHKPNEVLIRWKIKNIPSDLKGFVVARSLKNKGKFQILHNTLLPKNSTQFIDKTFNKYRSNYYIVQAIDTANNVSSSSPFAVVLIDSIPPKKPIIKSITIDSLGVAKINIVRNEEKDLMGYRVFRANSDTHEFSAIQESFKNDNDTPVQTVFKDTVTINSLTKNIFYRVKALDFNYNQSDFSDVYIVKRPDTIPPSTPVFKNIKAYDDRIELHFALSTSRDLSTHILYRKTNLSSKWNKLTAINNDQSVYTDKNVQKGVTYYYSLRAKDTSGLFSDFATAVYTNVIDKGILPVISNFNIKKNKNSVVLSWDYNDKDDTTYFVIYKKTKNQPLKQYKRTNTLNFEDVLTQDTVFYAVKAFNKKGNQSALSKLKKG